ncbi:MAG: DUF134 domain-containing protein [Calditrichia bacterium]
MSPRPHRKRWIDLPPRFRNFKPAGIPRRQLQQVVLREDEFEAIRLADFEGLTQDEAARAMEVSRPTFTRMIESARHKVADALLNGKELLIEGGKVVYRKKWQNCCRCGNVFAEDRIAEIKHCPRCLEDK